jgi:hypothetical protein
MATALLDIASRILTLLFFVGLAGACLVAVLFIADLFRTLRQSEPTNRKEQPLAE